MHLRFYASTERGIEKQRLSRLRTAAPYNWHNPLGCQCFGNANVKAAACAPAPLVPTLLFGFGFADVDLRPVDIGVLGLNFCQNFLGSREILPGQRKPGPNLESRRESRPCFHPLTWL